jgi:hypothetical protein
MVRAARKRGVSNHGRESVPWGILRDASLRDALRMRRRVGGSPQQSYARDAPYDRIAS